MGKDEKPLAISGGVTISLAIIGTGFKLAFPDMIVPFAWALALMGVGAVSLLLTLYFAFRWFWPRSSRKLMDEAAYSDEMARQKARQDAKRQRGVDKAIGEAAASRMARQPSETIVDQVIAAKGKSNEAAIDRILFAEGSEPGGDSRPYEINWHAVGATMARQFRQEILNEIDRDIASWPAPEPYDRAVHGVETPRMVQERHEALFRDSVTQAISEHHPKATEVRKNLFGMIPTGLKDASQERLRKLGDHWAKEYEQARTGGIPNDSIHRVLGNVPISTLPDPPVSSPKPPPQPPQKERLQLTQLDREQLTGALHEMETYVRENLCDLDAREIQRTKSAAVRANMRPEEFGDCIAAIVKKHKERRLGWEGLLSRHETILRVAQISLPNIARSIAGLETTFSDLWLEVVTKRKDFHDRSVIDPAISQVGSSVVAVEGKVKKCLQAIQNYRVNLARAE